MVSKLSDNVPLNITETLCVISNNSSKSWDKTIIEVPFLAKLINDSLIANSAPASIPQVGCEIINNFGLDDISLSLEKSDKIVAYENKLKLSKPWIFND